MAVNVHMPVPAGVTRPEHLPGVLVGRTVPTAYPGLPPGEFELCEVTACTVDLHTKPATALVTVEVPAGAAVPSVAKGSLDAVAIYSAQSPLPTAFYVDQLTIHHPERHGA